MPLRMPRLPDGVLAVVIGRPGGGLAAVGDCASSVGEALLAHSEHYGATPSTRSKVAATEGSPSSPT